VFEATQADTSAQSWRLLRSSRAPEFLLSFWHILFPSAVTMRRIYGVRSPLRVALLYPVRPFQLALRFARVLYRQMRPYSRTAPRKERGHSVSLPHDRMQ